MNSSYNHSILKQRVLYLIQKIFAKFDNLARCFSNVVHKINVRYTFFPSDVQISIVITQVYLVLTNFTGRCTNKIAGNKIPNVRVVRCFGIDKHICKGSSYIAEFDH